MKTYNYYIGIDCGVNTGLAIWWRSAKQFTFISTCKIHVAMDEVKKLLEVTKTNTFIRVEDARQRKWIPKERDIKQRVGRAKGAGSVSRDCKIWEDFLTDLKADFEMVAPKKGMTKHNAETFKRMTGYAGKTSEHARDAGLLVYGF